MTVTLTGSSSKATGTVTIKDGTKVVGTGTLSNGKVTITLKRAQARQAQAHRHVGR